MHVFEQLEWVMGCNKLAIYTEARRTMPPHSRLFQILSAALHVRILYSKILRRSHSIPNTGRGAKTRSFFRAFTPGCPKARPQQQRRDHKNRCLFQGASPPVGQPGSTQFSSRRARAQIHPRHAAITCTAARHWTAPSSPRPPIGRLRARPPKLDLRKGLLNAPAAFSRCGTPTCETDSSIVRCVGREQFFVLLW